MKLAAVFACTSTLLLSACSSQSDSCEDITIATEQIQECQALQRQIVSAKDKPIIRTELERRYQTDCVEMRYYRQEHQSAICGNKDKIDEIKEAVIEEQEQ